MKVKALLLDMDGTLVDSEQSVESSWNHFFALQAVGVEFTKEFHGIPAKNILRKVFPAADEALIESYFNQVQALEIKNAHTVKALAGTAKLISQLEEINQKLGRECWSLVTSCSKELFHARWDHLGFRVPATVVTADQVAHGKPHPEPYILGAKRLGINPKDALVIEDSFGGLESAIAAGAKTIGVATINDSAKLAKMADKVIDSVADLRVELAGEEIKVSKI